MTEEDSFEKVKKGVKETAKGLKETGEGLKKGVEETAEEVKKGVEDTAEVVAGTAESVKEGVEETADVFEDTAKEVTDSDTYSGSDQEKENRDYNEFGGKEPMNPEDIATHEPTAVKRDQDTEIAGEGGTGTDSPEAREKYRKKGMTET